MNKELKIKNFWNEQAIKYKKSSEATNPDFYATELEIENISKFLKNDIKVADIGCGNGYSTMNYAKEFNILIDGYDYSENMLSEAKKVRESLPSNIKNRISFNQANIKNLDIEAEQYDVVITDRCLINLTSREDQFSAIKQVHKILKPGGHYLMCENTEQGLKNLNRLRIGVGLEEIKVRWHNLYLDEEHLKNSYENLFKVDKIVKFASFYYLASRVINGKIAQEQNISPDYNSNINRIAKLISGVGEFGDFAPLKLFVLSKI